MAIGPGPDVSGNISAGAICVECGSGTGGGVSPNPNGSYTGLRVGGNMNQPKQTVIFPRKPAPAVTREPQGPNATILATDWSLGGKKGGNELFGDGPFGRGTPGVGFTSNNCIPCDHCGQTSNSNESQQP